MSYLHLQGSISLGEPDFAGTFGAFLPGRKEEANIDRPRVNAALTTLKQSNHLYGEFFSRAETVLGYFPFSNLATDVSCLPEIDVDFLHTSTRQWVPEQQNPVWIMPEGDIEGCSLPRNEAHKHVLGLQSSVDAENADLEKLKQDDRHLEEKLFPCLFPSGRGGWNSQTDGSLSFSSYLKMRLRSMDTRWRDDPKWTLFSFDRGVKSKVFAYNAVHVSVGAGVKAGALKGEGYTEKSRVMPNNVQGCKKTWQRHHQDLLAIIQELGKPTYFVTLTLNESDPDVQKCLRGRPARDCPVEITEVFFAKFDAIKPLLFGKTALYGPVEDYWYRVEFQQRGAPHFHIIVWVNSKKRKPVDEVVYATIPSEDDPELRDVITRLQVHKCTAKCAKRSTRPGKRENTKADEEYESLLNYHDREIDALEEQLGGGAECKYGFPFELTDSSGPNWTGTRYLHPRFPGDEWVVSYNPALALAWRAHHNIAVVTDASMAGYLAKYIAKSEPSLAARLNLRDDVDRYFTLRSLSVPEAVTYMLGHHAVQGTREVVFINTNLAETRFRKLKKKSVVQEISAQDPESTDIYCDTVREVYNERPYDLDEVNLRDFVRKYGVVTNVAYIPGYAKETFMLDFAMRYVYQRGKQVIARHRFLSPKDGEAYFFQKLLLSVPHRDENFISDDNNEGTYKEECYLRGLFDELDEVESAIKEATDRKFDPKFIAKLTRELRGVLDEPHSPGMEGGDEDDEDLKDLAKVLGLGNEEEEGQKRAEQQRFLEANLLGLTPSQQRVFAAFQDYLDHSRQMLAFITGAGGTGKSHLLRMLIALASGQYKLRVAVCAPSGGAAFLVGGKTIHKLFLFDLKLSSRLVKGSLEFLELCETKVIFVDEVSMMSAPILHAMDKVLRSIHGSAAPFGGVSIVLLGDLHQLPAVGQPNDHLLLSPLFPLFAADQLMENVRQLGDSGFVALLQRVRIGATTQEDMKALSSRVCGTGHAQTAACNASNFTSAAVTICSLNRDLDVVNARSLAEMEGFPVLVQSKDTILSHDGVDLGPVGRSRSGELLKTLELKIGARVVLTRNLDIGRGMVNGALGAVKQIHSQYIKVAFDHGMTENVTRVKQSLPYDETRMRQRHQFPLRLAFAVTVHRVQGMTVNHASIFLDDSFFCAGQAYVALSRVKSSDGLHLKVFSPKAILVDERVNKYYEGAVKPFARLPVAADLPPPPPPPKSSAAPGVIRVTIMPPMRKRTLFEEEEEACRVLAQKRGRLQRFQRQPLLHRDDIPEALRSWTRWDLNSCHFDSFEMAMRVALEVPVENIPLEYGHATTPTEAIVLFLQSASRGRWKQDFRDWFCTKFGDGRAGGDAFSSIGTWVSCFSRDPVGEGCLGITLTGQCGANVVAVSLRSITVHLHDQATSEAIREKLMCGYKSLYCQHCRQQHETLSINIHPVLAVEFAGGTIQTLEDVYLDGIVLSPRAVVRAQGAHFVTYLCHHGQWFLYDGQRGIHAPEILIDETEMIGGRDYTFYRVIGVV